MIRVAQTSLKTEQLDDPRCLRARRPARAAIIATKHSTFNLSHSRQIAYFVTRRKRLAAVIILHFMFCRHYLRIRVIQ